MALAGPFIISLIRFDSHTTPYIGLDIIVSGIAWRLSKGEYCWSIDVKSCLVATGLAMAYICFSQLLSSGWHHPLYIDATTM